MRYTIRALLLCTLGPMLMATPLAAQDRTVTSTHHEIRVETVATGLEHPWGLAFLPDGRFLVTERNPGRLRLGTPDGRLTDVRGVPPIFRYEGDTERSQAGLFDVALHPRFQDNRLVYLSLSKPSARGTGTAIVRGRLVEAEGGARLEDVHTVFEMNEKDQDSSGLHFGGRMAFHPRDASIFLSIGDRRNISRSQDPEDQAGSIIRIMDDGGMPRDNPFVNNAGKDDKLFSWGHRNPQGLAVHPQTGELWANEHGPKGGDEINLIRPGQNYGWPYLTGGVDYSGAPLGVGIKKEGMTSPVHVFEETVAPSGLAIYTGRLFSAWSGDLLNGGLVSEGLVRVRIQNGTVVDQEMIRIGRRIRDVKIGGDGAVWVITEHKDGEVLRLTPGARAAGR